MVISCTNDSNVPFLYHTCGKAFDKILLITTFIRIGGVVITGQLYFLKVMRFWCYFIFAVVKHWVFSWNVTMEQLTDTNKLLTFFMEFSSIFFHLHCRNVHKHSIHHFPIHFVFHYHENFFHNNQIILSCFLL